MAKEFLCLSCGNIGKPRLRNRGSSFIEIVLWLCFLIPGMLYTFWRMFRKERLCKTCNAPNPIPMDSPVAQRFINQTPDPEPRRQFGRQPVR